MNGNRSRLLILTLEEVSCRTFKNEDSLRSDHRYPCCFSRFLCCSNIWRLPPLPAFTQEIYGLGHVPRLPLQFYSYPSHDIQPEDHESYEGHYLEGGLTSSCYLVCVSPFRSHLDSKFVKGYNWHTRQHPESKGILIARPHDRRKPE